MAGRYKKGWTAERQRVFELYIQGVTPQEITKKLDCGIDKVRNIIRCTKFQEKHDLVEKNSIDRAKKAFDGKLADAANKIIRLMQTGKTHERLQFDAAKEILYQCGMKPVDVIETRGRDYTPEEIQSSLTVIKEVQEIEEKLSTQGSGFLIETEEDETSLSAPVTATTADKATQQALSDNLIYKQESDVEGSNIETTSSVGQETVPA